MELKKNIESKIVSKTIVTIRFSDVDSMGIVWHGNYVKYFEDGRESFGLEHGLHYLNVYKNGYFAPIVNIECNYKNPLRYGEKVIIETYYIDSEAAKIIHEYKLYRQSDNELVATGSSTQVFLNVNGELQLTIPAFFEEWKQKMKIK
ncbi:MAG: 4-hydroxybenzoyl-CoA thioesterase [Bacteroidetes bacterium GWA2_30_7]|nr:MAG: 4-hydroxybenzoyl-CoA thioesterase [Bacteroidetes bacterium GWA2_30_7]